MVTVFNFPAEISAGQREQLASRLSQERAILTRLSHPNILPIYDFGEQSGFLYLVIDLTKATSLGRILKEQGRFTPNQVLSVLKQLAAGLDFAHSKGVVHGILSLSNILISNDLTVQIAGFGLRTMLEICGNRQDKQPQGYLFGTKGIFLGMSAYISPERVQGMPVDARSDIYALGVMLFEMLSGTLPFNGAQPLDIALQRIQQPVPSLYAICPDVPEALDLLISKTLELDPAKRYQHAGDMATALERILKLLQAAEQSSASRTGHLRQEAQNTLPPTVNWFDEADTSSEKWQLLPPIVTGHLPVVTSPASSQETTSVVAGNFQAHPPAELLPGSLASKSLTREASSSSTGRPDSMGGFDPFAWWSTSPSPIRLKSSNSHPRRQPLQQDRRRIVGLLAAGAVTAGIFGIGGISFAHFISSIKQSQSQIASMPAAAPTSPPTVKGNTPTTAPTKGTQKTPMPSKSTTPKPSPSATKGPQPSPTAQPTQPPPTPTPPSHIGKVIGYTSQQPNSSKNFTNPADGHGSLLIHPGNGNFVACETACTHEGVAVYYNSGSGKLVCPAHGAIFDPFNGFSHISGPGNGPLPGVSIRVNKDGTITTG
jgi:serine/threonine protein kinase